MQTVDAAMLGSEQLRVDIDQADSEVLKLALIVIGLNKDIQNLLHPRYENGAIVRAVGQHDDSIVRQYAVWAVIENRRLDLSHLGTGFDRLESEPANVQAKLLELGASSIPDLVQRHDFILSGSSLGSDLAREGLAKGLLRTYYDGLETLTLDWFRTERSPRVKVLLAEHFARYSERLPSYEEEASEIALLGGDLKRHVLLGADGNRLFRRLQQPTAADGDLFGDPSLMQAGKLGMTVVKQTTTVLFMSATPSDQTLIRPEKEVAELRDRIPAMPHHARPLRFEHVWATQIGQIQQELIRHGPRILHFSGHGSRGEILFEHADETTAPLSGNLLARILEGYGELECLVLHACFAEEVARACLPHVPVVVGSNGAVDDVLGPKFTHIFYQAIASGRRYEQAYQMGVTEVALGSEASAQVYRIYQR